MQFEHYGFPPINRHPNHFFKEQVAHLMIAIEEACKPVVPVKKVYNWKENTAIQEQIKWMRIQSSAKSWVTAEETAKALGLKQKTASRNMKAMKDRGILINRRMRGAKPEYLMVG